MRYTELQVTSHFSFLRGASSPLELFSAAALMGHATLGITDRNSLGGVVQALFACDELGKQGVAIRPVYGCRLDLADGASLLVWPQDRAAGGRKSG